MIIFSRTGIPNSDVKKLDRKAKLSKQIFFRKRMIPLNYKIRYPFRLYFKHIAEARMYISIMSFANPNRIEHTSRLPNIYIFCRFYLCYMIFLASNNLGFFLPSSSSSFPPSSSSEQPFLA